MRELDVVGVRLDQATGQPMLLLRERGADRYLPIWIGAAEASAIANALEGVVPPRPLTHDLFVTTLKELGHTDVRARITAVRDSTFFGELEVDGHVISARPSDVVALAVRLGIVVRCPVELLDEVGVQSEPSEHDEVEKFREFLDSINPEDFTDEPGER